MGRGEDGGSWSSVAYSTVADGYLMGTITDEEEAYFGKEKKTTPGESLTPSEDIFCRMAVWNVRGSPMAPCHRQ